MRYCTTNIVWFFNIWTGVSVPCTTFSCRYERSWQVLADVSITVTNRWNHTWNQSMQDCWDWWLQGGPDHCAMWLTSKLSACVPFWPLVVVYPRYWEFPSFSSQIQGPRGDLPVVPKQTLIRRSVSMRNLCRTTFPIPHPWQTTSTLLSGRMLYSEDGPKAAPELLSRLPNLFGVSLSPLNAVPHPWASLRPGQQFGYLSLYSLCDNEYKQYIVCLLKFIALAIKTNNSISRKDAMSVSNECISGKGPTSQWYRRNINARTSCVCTTSSRVGATIIACVPWWRCSFSGCCCK